MGVKNINCELCEKHTATTAIKNKHNGKVFRVCKCCADYVMGTESQKVEAVGMTWEEKLQAIKDMGIDIWDNHETCPSQYGLIERCAGNSCDACWIKALEE